MGKLHRSDRAKSARAMQPKAPRPSAESVANGSFQPIEFQVIYVDLQSCCLRRLLELLEVWAIPATSKQTRNVEAMKTAAIRISLLVALPALFTVFPLHAQDVRHDDWQLIATERLKAIYDREVFRVEELDAEWLNDSTAYRIREKDPQTGKTVTAEYDVGSGQRQIVRAERRPNQRQSSDRKFALEVRGKDLYLSEHGDIETRLTETAEGREVAFQDFRWSSSDRAASFVKVDRTDVRLRNVLVPGDPSYPQVAEHRFARVGETIEGLEVGIVSVDQGEVRWFSLENAGEGFYLGQVDWVPNADELLVETLSRFRDRREFWLVKTDGKAKRIYREVNEAWAVGSHGIIPGHIGFAAAKRSSSSAKRKVGGKRMCALETGPLSPN